MTILELLKIIYTVQIIYIESAWYLIIPASILFGLWLVTHLDN